MKKIILIGILLCHTSIFCQSLYFPPISGNNWDTLSPSSLNWCKNNIDTLYTFLESKNTKAFILLKDGKMVLEKYFGSFTKDSIWYWASAGKSLTATLVGIAQEDKFLSIQDTSTKYIGNGWTKCTSPEENKITIKHQLSMTTGFDDGVPNNHCTADSCLKCIAAPGNRWAYHNAPYTLLDKVLETATGSPLNLYHNQRIKTKTGMTGLYVQTGDDNVYYSNARSMARFGLLILNKGKWENTIVLGDSNYYKQMVNTSQPLNLSYGYLWWLNGKTSCMVPTSQIVLNTMLCPNAPTDMFAALGKNGQVINIVPSQNLVFIRMGNAPDGSDVPFTLNDSIWIKLKNLPCKTSFVSNNAISPIRFNYISREAIHLDIQNETFLGAKLFDVHGKEIKIDIQDKIIEYAPITAGLYFIQLQTLSGVSVKRFYVE